jgi:phenylacetate-CoA ligase
MLATTISPFASVRDELHADLLDSGYDDLIARMAWDRERLLAHQRDRLSGLLRAAVGGSPFHRERLTGLDVESVQPDDLTGLPVMTKADLMEHFDDVVTDRRITLAAVEEALDRATDEPAVVAGDALALASGGSSGRRGVFVLDRAARRQFIGSLSRSIVARLRSTGVPPGGLSIAFVAAASPVHATRASTALSAGGDLPFLLTPVPVTLPLADIVDRLNLLRPQALYGYPSTLARLATEQQMGRLRLAPVSITCTAETLTPALRATIREGFGAPVIDSFGSSEGLVGVSAPDDEVINFAGDGCIVEPVDEHDRPVPPGTPSTAALVTVLESRLQPLIRYRMTDSLLALPPAPSGPGHLRARVQGRSDEELRFGPVVVHPLVVRSVLVNAPEVVEYQVRQTARGVAVRIVGPPAGDRRHLVTALTAALAGAGLPDPEVTVEAVSRLPQDPLTGKVRRVVPLG